MTPEEANAEIERLRAALAAPPKTCGTCRWGVEVFTENCPPDEVHCQRFTQRRKRDDGCLRGWTPKGGRSWLTR